LYSEFGWYSIVVVALLSFGLLGIEEAGMEIEDPFSPATGSLEELCKAARKNTEFICGVSTPAVLTEPPISGV
jgi:predicted membrane chloride channel (bestrophin family)